MPPVIEVFNQLEELTRRTRSSRMPMTRGTSPVWGNMMTTLGERRRGSAPGHERVVGRVVDGIRRRQDRVGSVPDQRHVEQVRREERGRGGPPVPHNSLDLSVINLSDSVDGNEETLQWETVEDDTTPEGPDRQDDDDDNIFDETQGVPPVDPNLRAMLEAVIERRISLETTIDLTDSPVRSPSSPVPLLSQSPPSQGSPSSSLKCPVCLETFSAIRQRGSRLVSTVCGHVFCGRCLPACVRTSGQCPACRKRIGYQDFHPLYLY